MGEITGQIEQEIVNERQKLGRSLDELETRARELADWRTHYRNHPRIALGVVFGAALAAGALAGSRRRSRHDAGPGLRAESYGPPDLQAQSFAGPDVQVRSRREPGLTRRQLEETWNNMWSALLGVATAKAIDLVGNVVPGFRDQYGRRSPGR